MGQVRIGPGACFGMGGHLRLVLVKEVALGLVGLEMLLGIVLSALLEPTPRYLGAVGFS